MASIFLQRRELGSGRLPNVCVVCGRRGQMTEVSLRQRKGLSFSRAAGTYDAVLPLCSSHGKYFDRGNLLLAGLLILSLIFLAGAVGSFVLHQRAIALSSFALFIVSAILSVVNTWLVFGRTHAESIEERGVQLASVSQDFVDALDDQREGKGRGRQRGEAVRRPAPASGSLALGAALGGVVVALLASGGVAAYFFFFSKGPETISAPVAAITLTRDRFETVRLGMPEREAVGILGEPARTVGMKGPLPRWDEVAPMKTMYWQSGAVRIEVLCTGGQVSTMKGTFDPAETNPPAWTEANFHLLKQNMPRAELLAILGPPPEIIGNGQIEGVSCTSWVWTLGQVDIRTWFKGDRLYDASGSFNGKYMVLTGRIAGAPSAAGGGKTDANTPAQPRVVTMENFRRLKLNMTTNEVRAILGPPTTEKSLIGATMWVEGGNSISVYFSEGTALLVVAIINGQSFSLKPPELDFP